MAKKIKRIKILTHDKTTKVPDEIILVDKKLKLYGYKLTSRLKNLKILMKDALKKYPDKKLKIIIALALLIPITALAFSMALYPPKTEFGIVEPNVIYTSHFHGYSDTEACFKAEKIDIAREGYKLVPDEWITIQEPIEFCLEPYEVQQIDFSLEVLPKYKIDKGLTGDYWTIMAYCSNTGGSTGLCLGMSVYFSLD